MEPESVTDRWMQDSFESNSFVSNNVFNASGISHDCMYDSAHLNVIIY
jgi:hypothetical protein